MHWSLLPVKRNFPSEEKSIVLIGAVCAFNNWDFPCTELFQILTVQSLELPKGFIATSFILSLCPINLNGLVFGAKFQTNIFPSSLPVNACFL